MYFEVTFKQGGKSLWLPRRVNVSGQMGRYTYQNRHDYSNYRLFVVQTEEVGFAPAVLKGGVRNRVIRMIDGSNLPH